MQKKSGEGARELERLRQPLLDYFRAKRLTGIDPEDLTQEVMARVHRALGSVGDGNLRAFTFVVAANLLRDWLRRKKSAPTDQFDDDKIAAIADPQPSPERRLEHRELAAQALAALKELDKESRNAFILDRIEGLSHGEIARRLGISEPMVRRRVKKAFLHVLSRTAEDKRGHE